MKRRRTPLTAALLALGLGLGLGAGMAVASDGDAEPPPTATPAPVFLTLVPEGGRVAPPPVDPRAAQQAAATESVMATVANLQRVGLFAIQFMALLLLAGLGGALLAGLISLIKSRRPAGSELR